MAKGYWNWNNETRLSFAVQRSLQLNCGMQGISVGRKTALESQDVSCRFKVPMGQNI